MQPQFASAMADFPADVRPLPYHPESTHAKKRFSGYMGALTAEEEAVRACCA